MLDDAALLAAVPDYFQVGGLLKATPSQEGDRRIIYFEASNEDVDHQGEVVLQKALEDSSAHYLRHGNIDLSHFTMLGPKMGLANYHDYEIGRPIEVRVDGRKTFVKAELYKGESPMAKNATMVWDSMTKQSPAARWYPSVGGAVLAKSVKIDPVTKNKIAVVEKVRWANTALDRQPVNKTVAEASAAPVGVFAKSLGGFVMSKMLTAGYGTDSAGLEGGAALRKQSLDRRVANYWDFREAMAGALKSGRVKEMSAGGMSSYGAKEFGLSQDEAAEYVERFMRDLKNGLKKRNGS